MFSFDDLRPIRLVEEGKAACPVRDCATRVPQQSRTFRTDEEFQCVAHGIVIGKSTFEYQDRFKNLLWHSPADRQLLQRIADFKRESRIGRERSEDAVSWNAFRHLQLSGRLDAWVTSMLGRASAPAHLHYWSFDEMSGGTWEPLSRARQAFDEVDGRGSEPDLIISTPDAHIWVEAKFGSTNRSGPPSDRNGAKARYGKGGDGWFAQTVSSSFDTIAIDRGRYELLRLWLLGSWAAAQDGRQFVLVNLVRQGLEKDGPDFAEAHFKPGDRRSVRGVTWESVYDQVSADDKRSIDDEKLLRYMRSKTLGYTSSGHLVKAFSVT